MSEKSVNVKVTAPPRIHMGLIDCGNATPRQFGGCGFAVDGLYTHVKASPASRTSLRPSKYIDISERTTQDIKKVLHLTDEAFGKASVRIKTMPPEHRGFGSKTSILLSVASAVYGCYYGQTNDFEAIVRLTNRGGASGVGVNTFWHGGFVRDAGHLVEPGKRLFLPSAASTPLSSPPLISHFYMPDNWYVHLYTNTNAKSIEGEREVEFFKKITPLPDIDIYKTISVIDHGICPAIKERDIVQLGHAVSELNQTGMKKHEVKIQPPGSIEFLKQAWQANLPAGVSSFGPTIYIIDKKNRSNLATIREIASKCNGVKWVGTFDFDNNGVRLEMETKGGPITINP